MARISRITQKIFAGSASNNGVFGSAQLGTFTLSNLIATIMGGTAWAQGWLAAVIGGSKFPPLEEFQAVEYVHSTQIAYILQQGIPEYDGGTTYFTNNICINPGTLQLWSSKVDNNTGNVLVAGTNWQLLFDMGNIGTIPSGATRSGLRGASTSNTAATYTANSLVLNTTSGSQLLLTAYNESLATGTAGAGGIDTGTIAASTWYYVWAIYNQTTSTPSIIFSLQSTLAGLSSHLPTGYTYALRIGSFYSDGSSHIEPFVQSGADITYTNVVNILSNGTTAEPSFSSVSTVNAVPPTSQLATFYMVNQVDNVNAISFLYQLNGGPAFAASVSNGTNFYSQAIAFVIIANEVWYNAAASPTPAVYITVLGYKENF